MNRPTQKSWLVCAVVVGVVYFLIGRFFPNPDSSAGAQTQLIWRLGAWLVSAVVFAFHIGYENFGLRNSPLTTALHTSAAVALGAFLLALAAMIRALTLVSHVPFSRYLLALALWPVFTFVPSFLVSFFIAAMLVRLPRKRVSE